MIIWVRHAETVWEILYRVDFMQQICSVAISVLTVVEIFIPIIKYGISKHSGVKYI